MNFLFLVKPCKITPPTLSLSNINSHLNFSYHNLEAFCYLAILLAILKDFSALLSLSAASRADKVSVVMMVTIVSCLKPDSDDKENKITTRGLAYFLLSFRKFSS